METTHSNSESIVEPMIEPTVASAVAQAASAAIAFREPKKEIKDFSMAPNLSEYLDYRKFLSDFFEYKKFATQRSLRPYSYAMFSAAADIRSPNYLKMIIEGKRNLSEDMISKFAKALDLNKAFTNEFKILVLFNQEQDPAQRNILLKELVELRVQNKLESGAIDAKVWNKIPNWVTWVLHSMLDQSNVDFDPEKLKKQIRGNCNVDEIRAAIESLKNSGQAVVTENGQLEKVKTPTETPEEIPVELVRKLQAELMYLGMESLFKDHAAEREFGSLTLSLTPAEFEEVKFQLRKMRKQIHKDNAIKRMASKGDRVYQLNIQLFPVTE